MRIVGPNFQVVLRLRSGVVAEAARPVSYMRGWQVARVLALAKRWGWKAELSDGERQQATAGPQQPAHSGRVVSDQSSRLVTCPCCHGKRRVS